MKVIVEKLPYSLYPEREKDLSKLDALMAEYLPALSRAACDLSWNLRYDAYAGSILEGKKKKKKDLEEGLTCRIILE